MNEESNKFVDEIEAALNDVFTRNKKMLTKFVLAVENVDSEGDRTVWITRRDDMMPWDTVGLLMFAIQIEQAKTNAHEFLAHGVDPD